jgi:hypothetical protein
MVGRGFRNNYCDDCWRPGPQQGYAYTIGRWESNTFGVETARFKEGSWLDKSSHPHTDALSTTERCHAGFGSTGTAVRQCQSTGSCGIPRIEEP